jgi:hypothetical protein
MQVDRIQDELWRLAKNYTPKVFPDLTIEKGFVWNGASIPQIVKNIISNEDYGVLESSCAHDFLYNNGGYVSGDVKLTRAQVDKIFYHELKYYGVGGFRSYMAYKAVRIFGKSHWFDAQ